MAVKLEARAERWPMAVSLAVAGEVISDSYVVVATVSDGVHAGQGECSPLKRFGHSPEGVLDQLKALTAQVENGLDCESLQRMLSRGPARNALDCALWDLKARTSRRSIWTLLGWESPAFVSTLRTVGIDTPERMAQAAKTLGSSLIKLKLGAPGDLERVQAVRDALPAARIFVDVNEGWTFKELTELASPLHSLGVEGIEQPLSAKDDSALFDFDCPIPLIADESCQDCTSLDHLVGRYDFVNIKLDKTGGLTEALSLIKQARARGLRLMVGCMPGTSLAMAPAFVVASQCEIVDLDAPCFNAADRKPGILYRASRMDAPPPGLWGNATAP